MPLFSFWTLFFSFSLAVVFALGTFSYTILVSRSNPCWSAHASSCLSPLHPPPLSQLRFFFPPYCVWARHIYHATCRSEPSLSRCHPTSSSSPPPPAPCATTLPHNACASHVILKIKELPPANQSKTKCHAVPCPKSKTRRSQESPVTIPPNSNSAKVIPRPPASSC